MIARNISRALVGAWLAGTAAVPALAQDGPQLASASTIAGLIEEAETFAAGDTAARERFANEFRAAAPDRQQAMLREAEAERNRLRQESEQVNEEFAENEDRVGTAQEQLSEKARTLGLDELFGVAKQVANDTAQVLEQSLITTQIQTPAGELSRDVFLRQFASPDAPTPTIAELERVWIEMLREMSASGQVARYQAAVVQPAGQATNAEVIRIGPFNATSEGQFLEYRASLQRLAVLPRQLPAEFHEVLDRFQEATSGYAQAVVDSSRGVLLGLYVERPTLEERIELGEEVGYVIIVVGALGILAFLFQLVYLVIVRVGVRSQLKNLNQPRASNPLGRVLLAFKGDKSRIEEDADIAELRISEAVLREVPKLERFQAFLRLCVAAGPLLGLIGTVVGMIITFQSITESGSSDPRLMATGIGQAMIATVLGLGIAIPLLFAGALLNSLSRTVVQILDEQSAGILADSIEKQRHAGA